MVSEWKNENWWVSKYNYLPEIRNQIPDLPKKVKFHDVTLRDGEQTPGVVFRKEEKIQIAQMLDEVGVDRIEVALPAVSNEDVEATKAIVKIRPKAEVFVLSRVTESDINLAVECGVDGIILEVPVGTPRLTYQFKNWTQDDVINKTKQALKYARKKGLKIVLFPMDSTRAEPEFFDRFLENISKGSKPDSIALVDTTGCLIPQAAMYMIRRIKEITNLITEIHTHSDFGLAVSTSIAAVSAGAEVVHTSIAGIGERSGNTPLEVVACTLKSLYGLEMGIDFSKLSNLGREVCKIAGINIPANKPVIGERAFTRESGMGINLIREFPLALFALNPEFVGQKSQYVLGKKSGILSVEMKLKDLGMENVLDEKQKIEVLKFIKIKGIEKKGLITDEEFKRIVQDIIS